MIEHVDTTDRRSIENIGRWDTRNVTEALSAIVKLARRLPGAQGVVYLPISQGIPGLVRDTTMVVLANRMGWKVAVHLRGSELAGVYRRQMRPVRAWLRSTLARIDSFAVLGESLRNSLDGVIDRSKITVVPNGTPDPGGANGRQESTGVYLGNLYPRKGAQEAMEAAVMVASRRPDARFIFAGECPDSAFRRRLEDLAAQANGQISIRPPVFGDEKQKLLLSSGFFLFPPARQEGHPRVVLEALAAGLPIVTTDRGVISETVIDGESGFVLPYPIPADLADRIIELNDDPSLRERMGRAARERYLAKFTQDAADRALADWLHDLASRP